MDDSFQPVPKLLAGGPGEADAEIAVVLIKPVAWADESAVFLIQNPIKFVGVQFNLRLNAGEADHAALRFYPVEDILMLHDITEDRKFFRNIRTDIAHNLIVALQDLTGTLLVNHTAADAHLFLDRDHGVDELRILTDDPAGADAGRADGLGEGFHTDAVAGEIGGVGKALSHCQVSIYGFNGEESNPLGGTFGSRAVTGLVSPDQPDLEKSLKEYGHTVQEIMDCRRDFSDAKCYLELHIEQGDYLYNEGLDIGVVSGIVGIVRYRVTVKGHSNHAGTTMMKNRRDALVAMSKLIVAADQRCRAIDDTLVFTVGTIRCWPGSENVIPGEVECSFEMRHMDHEKTDELARAVEEIAAGIPNIKFEMVKMIDKGSVRCDPHLMQRIEAAAAELGVQYAVIPSGAGHDANPMAHRLPMGMIFVPSEKGLSHCGEEWTDSAHLEYGADILYRTVLKLDQEE